MRKIKIKKSSVEYDEILISEVLRQIALSTVSIFVPVYLYKLGFSLRVILLFFLLEYLVFLILLRPVGRIAAFLHPKRAICLSYLLNLAALILLSSVENNGRLLLAAGALSGAASCMYWIPFHANFSRVLGKKALGSKIAFMEVVVKFASIIGPIAGAAVATYFGGDKLFLVAAVLLVMAALPLLATRDIVKQRTIRYNRISKPALKSDKIGCIASGIHDMAAAITWPVYLTIFFVSYAKIGTLVGISTAIGFIILIVVGKLNDRGWGRLLLTTGSIAGFAANVLRFGTTTFFAGAATIVQAAAYSLSRTPFLAAYYNNADRGNRLEYIVTVETAAYWGHIAVIAILITATMIVNTSAVLQLSFVLSGVAALFMPFLRARTR